MTRVRAGDALADQRPTDGRLSIANGAAWVFTDFMFDNGFSRFLLIDESMVGRQPGRAVQRPFEIETYRMLALLGLPVATEVGRWLNGAERRLAELMDHIGQAAARKTNAPSSPTCRRWPPKSSIRSPARPSALAPRRPTTPGHAAHPRTCAEPRSRLSQAQRVHAAPLHAGDEHLRCDGATPGGTPAASRATASCCAVSTLNSNARTRNCWRR